MAKVMEEDVGLKGLRDTQCARLIAEQVCRQGAHQLQHLSACNQLTVSLA